MTSNAATPYERLSREQAARVDRACDDFEKAWKEGGSNGQRPDLRVVLAAFQEPERTVLAQELIALDQAYRREWGDATDPANYQGLCADYDRRLAARDTTAKNPPANFGACPEDAPRIPGCEIVAVLGIGGMGIVYKARQPALGRFVAVKTLRDDGMHDADHHERFLREARAVAQVQHPNLVQVYEVGEACGRGQGRPIPYFVLEYVRGGSLAQFLRGAAPPPREAARLMEVVARAAQHAHQHGIIHRDLKPANVLLQTALPANDDTATPIDLRTAVPKIADFGVARLGDGSQLTQTGDVLGTPSYMAPEQTEGKGIGIGPATDVYGLGAILYEMLTGRPPFKAETALATVLQVREDEPVSIRRLQPTVPRDLETICLECLHKDPRRRYATAAALAEDLCRFLDGRPIAARRTGMAERAVKWVRRRPAVAGLLATVLVVAALGFVGVLWQWRKTVTALDQSRQAYDATQAHLYLNQIALAQHELVAHHVNRAERLLEESAFHLRGWEWHYLKRQCQTDLYTLHGHRTRVQAVAYSPDGELLASGSGDWYSGRDGALMIWDARTGRRLQTLTRDAGTVYGLAFHPDRKRLAAACFDGKVRIWDARTGQVIHEWPAHRGIVNNVAFSPDGRLLVSAGRDTTVRLWDVEAGRPRQRPLTEHQSSVWGIAFSPDGRYLATSDWSGIVHLRDVDTGAPIRSFSGFSDVRAVAFSPDGAWLAVAGYSGVIGLWDLTSKSGKPVVHNPNAGAVLGLAFCPDGRLAWSARDGTIRIQDRRTGGTLRSLRGHDGWAPAIAISPDGRRLASGGVDGTVRIWDAATEQTAPQSMLDDGAVIPGIAYYPDDKLIALGGLGDMARIWDVATRRPVFSESTPGTGPPPVVTAAAAHPDGRSWAWVGTDGGLRIVDCGSPIAGPQDKSSIRKPQTEFRQLNAAPVTGLAYSADGHFLAWGGADGFVRICAAASGKELNTLGPHGSAVTGVAFHPGGEQMVTAGNDGTYCVWTVASGQPTAHFGAPVPTRDPDGSDLDPVVGAVPPLVTRLAFSPDGRRLAAANPRRPLEIWDVSAGRVALILDWGGEGVGSVAWSADGHRIAAAQGRIVRVWDASEQDPEARRRATETDALAWHRREAYWAEVRWDWFATTYHVGKLIEAEPGIAAHFARRAAARACLADAGWGRWDGAVADIAKAVDLRPENLLLWHQHALLTLAAGDQDGYQSVCAKMLARFGESDRREVANTVAWTCSLGPVSVADLSRPVALARRAHEKDLANLSFRNTLGTALYRAGDFEGAREQFAEAMKVRRPSENLWDSLCLAMVHHRLNQPEKARALLDRALKAIDLTIQYQPPPGSATPLSWTQQLELRLLRREAESLLQGATQ